MNYKNLQKSPVYFSHIATFVPFFLKGKVKRGGAWHKPSPSKYPHENN